jgi:cytochrome c oxidase subunit 3
MSHTVTNNADEGKIWGGATESMGASYGKMMMWFFIVSDALTFSAFLASYGFSRFKFIDSWPIADDVFTHFPFLHGVSAPMYYVALMTFILIFSSVTMVLAVDAGHQMQKKKVTIYMALTIIGGLTFVGSQAWEWKNFIKGEYGAVETKGGSIMQFIDTSGKRVALEDFVGKPYVNKESSGALHVEEHPHPEYTVKQVIDAFTANPTLLLRTPNTDPATKEKIILSRAESLKMINTSKYVVEGANLQRNEYGQRLFGDFFFFITGFHGFHVFSGIVINIIIFLNVLLGTYEARRSYEMVEKVGLYWHFVDLVWVFVFTFFYLV